MRLFIASLLGCLLLLSRAHGQTASSVANSFRTPRHTIPVSDLPPNYRAVTLGGSGLSVTSFGVYGLMGMGADQPETAKASIFISLVDAIMVDPDEFAELLDGKRARIRGFCLDIPTMSSQQKQGVTRGSVPTPFFTETWLESGRVIQWTPRPQLGRDLLLKTFAAPAPEEEAKATALARAKQLTIGIAMYCGDYDDTFPLADSTAAAKPILQPYVKDKSAWDTTNPAGGRFLYNTHLSAMSPTSLENPAQTPVIWDEKAWPDGGRFVGFADGHAKYVTAEVWELQIWDSERARRIRENPKGDPRDISQATSSRASPNPKRPHGH